MTTEEYAQEQLEDDFYWEPESSTINWLGWLALAAVPATIAVFVWRF